MPNITFVDAHNNVIGAGSRSEAIEKGIAHRVVRINIFNSQGELLIQRRSEKVAFPGVWDQSVGGHVDEGESYVEAAERELGEELGISTPLTKVAEYYSEEYFGNIVLKRFNRLYTATYNGEISFNREEISEIKWVKPEEVKIWMQEKPDDFSQGFRNNFKVWYETL